MRPGIPHEAALLSALPYFIATSAFVMPGASAQEKAAAEETIIVSASRSETNLWNSPATIQIIDSRALENATHVSIADALRDIPGVDVTDNALAGRKQIRIRGEASSRVLVLIDGQQVTYQRAGQDYGAGLLIDESALARIEVVKGPWSVLYGSQAIGGVVNFITKKGGPTPLGGLVKATWNSSTAGWQESAAAWGSIGPFDYRINGSYSDQGNRKTPDGRLENTHFRNNGQGMWLGYTVGRHKVGLSVDRYRLSTQTWLNDPGGQFEAFSVKIPKMTREKIGVFYDANINGTAVKKIHFDAYSQTIERRFENQVATTQPIPSPAIQALSIKNQIQTNDKQYTQGATLQSHFSLPADNDAILGVQYQYDKVKQNAAGYARQTAKTGAFDIETRTQSQDESEQRNASLFAQDTWHVGNNWAWTLGARQYWLASTLINSRAQKVERGVLTRSVAGGKSTHDNHFVGATSLNYSGFDDIELRVAFAQGYVFPTLVQQFMQTSAGGGLTYGNPRLRPEHSNNYEIGARYKGNMWLVDSTVYYAETKDYIASLACAGQAVCQGNGSNARANYRYYDNINQAKTYGIELSAEYNGWAVSPYLSGNLLRRQYQSRTLSTWHTGEPVINGRVGVKHSRVFNALNVTSDAFIRVAAKARENVGDHERRYPGWATLNLALSTEFGKNDRYRVNLALNNLTNKRYQSAHESIPEAGFNAAISLGWVF